MELEGEGVIVLTSDFFSGGRRGRGLKRRGTATAEKSMRRRGLVLRFVVIWGMRQPRSLRLSLTLALALGPALPLARCRLVISINSCI